MKRLTDEQRVEAVRLQLIEATLLQKGMKYVKHPTPPIERYRVNVNGIDVGEIGLSTDGFWWSEERQPPVYGGGPVGNYIENGSRYATRLEAALAIRYVSVLLSCTISIESSTGESK